MPSFTARGSAAPLVRWLALLQAACLVSSFGRLGDFFHTGKREAAARALEEEAGCTDAAGEQQCQTWADAGECKSNLGYMKNNCRKSCKMCAPRPYLDHDTLASCVDDNRECQRWAGEEECDKNPDFMLKTCKAACRQCQSLHCNDAHADCVNWAEAGECQKNGDYMLSEVRPRAASPAAARRRQLTCRRRRAQCKFSCNMCSVNFKAECRRDKAMEPKAVPGTIDETMRRALEHFPQYRPSVLHEDPWILHFENFLSHDEARVACTRSRRPPPNAPRLPPASVAVSRTPPLPLGCCTGPNMLTIIPNYDHSRDPIRIGLL